MELEISTKDGRPHLVVSDHDGRVALAPDADTYRAICAHARAWLDEVRGWLRDAPEQDGPCQDDPWPVCQAVRQAAEDALPPLWRARNWCGDGDFARGEYVAGVGEPIPELAKELARVARPVVRRVAAALGAEAMRHTPATRSHIWCDRRDAVLRAAATLAIEGVLRVGADRAEHMQRSLGAELVAIALAGDPALRAQMEHGGGAEVLRRAWIYGRHVVPGARSEEP